MKNQITPRAGQAQQTASPDRPYYAAEDFQNEGLFALYVDGARCNGGFSRAIAESGAKAANDRHESELKAKRLIAAAPAMREALLALRHNVDVSTINNSKRTTAKWAELVIQAESALALAERGVG